MSTSASALLRERGAASWAAAVSHPMVAEIGAGTLPHETFRYYFEQNVLYLEDYARAIALIIGRAPDLAAVTRADQVPQPDRGHRTARQLRLPGPAGRSRPGQQRPGQRHLARPAVMAPVMLRLHPAPARHGRAA